MELIIDLENGLPVFSMIINRLIVKYYDDEAILFCEMDKNDLKAGFIPVDNPTQFIFSEDGEQCWRVQVAPLFK